MNPKDKESGVHPAASGEAPGQPSQGTLFRLHPQKRGMKRGKLLH